MKKIDLGQAITILANLGVIAGIVFLGFDLRQNTRSIQAAASQGITEAESQAVLEWVDHPDIVVSFTKSELTDEEVIRLHSFLVLYVRSHENYWSQHRLGAIDDDTLRRYENSILVILSYPRNRNWWNSIRGNFDPSFEARIDSLLDERGAIPISAPDLMRSLFDVAPSE
jgi:hypothetical protein